MWPSQNDRLRYEFGLDSVAVASMKLIQDEIRTSARSRKVVGDPYALSPERAAEPDLGDERDLRWIEHDDDLGIWIGPFVMASINTRVVRRSNALQGWAYGRRFRYREVRGFGAGPAEHGGPGARSGTFVETVQSAPRPDAAGTG
jgi:short subunit dehydrogenase-like uncharacterized protein